MRTVRMELSFPALLGWVLPVGLLVGGAGAGPTWWLAGRAGLVAELLAGTVVLPIMVASALIVLSVASSGAALTSAVFVSIGVMRLAAVVTTALILERFCRMATLVFWICILAFYLAMLGAEVAWLARALKRDALQVALGRIHRPSVS